MSTFGKPVSVTRASGSSLNTTPLPANSWTNNGQWGGKPPGSDAGFAKAAPQLPTAIPQAPAPKPQGATPPPAGQQAGTPTGLGGILNGGIPGIMGKIKSTMSEAANPGYDTTARMTQSVPPLSALTPRLGSFQGPADSALQFIQSAVKDDPARFAGLVGGLAPGLTSGLLSTGPVGMAALPGLYGLLNGGESFAAANQMFKPLLARPDAG